MTASTAILLRIFKLKLDDFNLLCWIGFWESYLLFITFVCCNCKLFPLCTNKWIRDFMLLDFGFYPTTLFCSWMPRIRMKKKEIFTLWSSLNKKLLLNHSLHHVIALHTFSEIFISSWFFFCFRLWLFLACFLVWFFLVCFWHHRMQLVQLSVVDILQLVGIFIFGILGIYLQIMMKI